MFIIFCLHLYWMRLRVRVMLDFSFSLFESGHTYTYECRSVGFGWYSRTSYVKQKSNKNNTISSALGISLKMALFVCGVLSCWWNVSFFLFFRISLSTKTVFLIFLLPLPLPLSPPLSLFLFHTLSFHLILSHALFHLPSPLLLPLSFPHFIRLHDLSATLSLSWPFSYLSLFFIFQRVSRSAHYMKKRQHANTRLVEEAYHAGMFSSSE